MNVCPSCSAPVDGRTEICARCARPVPLGQGVLLASRYEILGHLGRGGMGSVYKAHDRTLNETVAIKTLRPDVAASPDMAQRFLSEIKLARRIGHRNVCRIFEYGEDGPLRFIAMEHIEGIDLRKLIQQNGPFTGSAGLDVALQIASGLEAIHELGVIHRDLKTANLMRDARGVIKLMDFGIAKEWGAEGTTHATATGTALGTPEYMSPEQAEGEKVDFRTDVYAFGVVLFELYAGDVPFRGTTPMATVLKHIQEPPPLDGPRAAPIPAALIPLLRRALAKRREERQQSMTEMIEALRQAQDAMRSAAAPPPGGATAVPVDEHATLLAKPKTATPPSPVSAPHVVQPVATVVAKTPPSAPAVIKSPLPASVATGTPPPRPSAPRPFLPPRQSLREARSLKQRGGGLSRPVVWVTAGATALAVVTGVIVAVTSLRETPAPGTAADSGAPPSRSASPALRTAGLATPLPSAAPAFAPMAPTPAAAAPPTAVSYAPAQPTSRPGATPRPRPTLAPPRPTPVPTSVPPPATAADVAGSPETREPGELKVVVLPWADVAVDGTPLGTTPIARRMSPGPHTVRLTHPSYRPLTKNVEIRSGQTTRLDLNMKDEAFPLPGKPK